MTKIEFDNNFRIDILPDLIISGEIIDKPLISMTYSNEMDSKHKSGEITDKQAFEWIMPPDIQNGIIRSTERKDIPNLSIIDQLEKLNKKRDKLLKEYKLSLLAENSTHMIEQIEFKRQHMRDYYVLVDLDTTEVTFSGSLSQIYNYVSKRRISQIFIKE